MRRTDSNYELDVELFDEPLRSAVVTAISPSFVDQMAALFGDTEGWLFIGIGTDQFMNTGGKVEYGNWRETPFAWPRQADEMTQYIATGTAENGDVHFTPGLSANPVRDQKRRQPLPVTTLWVDLGDNPHTERVQRLIDGGAWQVASGSAPHRRHLYIPLVKAASPNVAVDLNARAAGWLGGDPSPSHHGAYLRPVGTSNHKPRVRNQGDATPVELVQQPCEARWTVETLNDLLPRVERASADNAVVASPERIGNLPAELADLLNEPVGRDRSGQQFAAVRACIDAGLTDGQIITIIRQHPPSVDKWGAKPALLDKHTAVCTSKLRAQPLSALCPAVDTVESGANAAVAGGDDINQTGGRRLRLTPASSFKLRRVRWLWHERFATGTISLLAGPEGLGKSTVAYWIAARVTRGDLPGEQYGHPRGVLICATEDSWEHTIVPRPLAHGADLDRVYRIDVEVADLTVEISLPADVAATEQAAADVDAALLILDPLMSRLHAKLDAHKDGEVRRALEPVAAMADRAGLSVLGLIHHNKSGSTNPLDLVMASKAFTAVARSVHTAIRDPDDDTGQRRLFGTPKNNLGRDDMPTMSFTIETYHYDTDDGQGSVGRVVWGDDVAGTIADALRRNDEAPEYRTAVADAVDWLEDYMRTSGPTVLSSDVKAAAKKVGIADRTLTRARQKLKIAVDSTTTFPRQTFWTAPQHEQPDEAQTQPGHRPLGETHLGLTDLNEADSPRSGTVGPVRPVRLLSDSQA